MNPIAGPPPHRRRRGMRTDQLDLANRLRDQGKTWLHIAGVFAERFRVNPLVAIRLAHGWSQRDVADLWNRKWPEDAKTFKNISYWENWPAATGYSPSLTVLGRLAELYSCNAADLISDHAHHRRRDPYYTVYDELAADTEADTEADTLATRLAPALEALADTPVEEVAAAGLLWADELPGNGQAYTTLQRLSAGLALAATMRPRYQPPSLALAPGERPDEAPASGVDLAGLWRSSRHTVDGCDQQYLLLRHQHQRLVGSSLPHLSGQRLRLDLELDGLSVAGTWTQHAGNRRLTDVFGLIRLTYRGQDDTLRGSWLAYDSLDPHPRSGHWELTRLPDHPPETNALTIDDGPDDLIGGAEYDHEPAQPALSYGNAATVTDDEPVPYRLAG